MLDRSINAIFGALSVLLSATPVVAADFAGEPCGWTPALGPLGESDAIRTEEAGLSGPRSFDAFTNFGQYMPRIHCMRTADGSPDWPWIVVLVGATAGVVLFYARIYTFWRRAYMQEAPRDRNKKLMELANIFFWCAICGYGMSMVMFVWPAYRLLAVFLIVLNIWSLKFILSLDDFKVSLSAKRLERELRESLADRNAELERLVHEKTKELELARGEAVRANEAKSRFLANMSHEIRTPMTSVLGFSELAREQANDEAALHASLDAVRRNGEHLLELISDVLDISKIESGRLEISPQPDGLRQTVRGVREILGVKAAEKGIGLEIEGLEGLPTRAGFDAVRVRQILVNLIGNAVKFTDSGSVRVIASFEESASDGSGLVRARVIDTGCGIDPVVQGKLFRHFEQGDATVSRAHGGTGLGLAISRELAQRMGGDVWLERSDERGSEFVATFCVSGAEWGEEEAGAGLERETAESGEKLTGLRVLLADDSVDNRRLLSHHLRRFGAAVEAVVDGREALERLRESGAYDVVILDMMMPVMDGYEAAGAIRASGLGVPVLALTANAMSDDRSRCLEAGCDEFMTKPVSRGELVSTVSRLAATGSKRAA